MALMFEKLDTSTAVAAAGIHIPVADLPGITSGEMVTSIADSKVALSLVEAIYENVNALTNKLGVAVTKASPAGAGNNLINQNYSITFQNVIDLSARQTEVLPLNGSNFGRVLVTDIFTSATKVDPSDTPGKGIVIPDAVVIGYGGADVPVLGLNDARQWLQGLWFSMVDELDLGNGVVARSRGNIQGQGPSANFTGTDAITGILAADLPLRAFYSVVYSATFQLLLDQATQTFDVNLD